MPEACASFVEEVLVALAGIAPDDATQRGVCLQRRRINPDRLAFDQTGVKPGVAEST
jgi:hypothetical protein